MRDLKKDYIEQVTNRNQSSTELAFVQLILDDLAECGRKPTLYEKLVIIPRLSRNLFLLTTEYDDLHDGGTVSEGTSENAMDRQSPRFKNYKEIQAMVEKDEKALNLSFDSKKQEKPAEDEGGTLGGDMDEREQRLKDRANGKKR